MSKPADSLPELPAQLWFTTNIAGYEVEVFLVEGLSETYGAFGVTLTGQPGCAGPIYLEETLLGTEGLEEVLIHEMVHVIDDIFGLGLTETKVRTLGLGLHQMFLGIFTLETTGLLPWLSVLQSALAEGESDRPGEDDLKRILEPNLD